MKDKDKDVRYSAAGTLFSIGGEAKVAVPILIEALKDNDATVRWSAALAFEKMGRQGKAAVPALIEALKDKDKDVRRIAAAALGSIGEEAKAAIPPLIEALKNKDGAVRYSAAAALGSIGGETKEVIPLLIEALEAILKDKDKSPEMLRQQAADALKVIGESLQNKAGTISFAELDQAIKDLEKAVEVLQALKETQDKNLESNIVSISRSLDALKKIRQSRLLERILEWMVKHPWAIVGLICIIFFSCKHFYRYFQTVRKA